MPQHTAGELMRIFANAGVSPATTSKIFSQAGAQTEAGTPAPDESRRQLSAGEQWAFQQVGHTPGAVLTERELEFLRRFNALDWGSLQSSLKSRDRFEEIKDWFLGASLQEPTEIGRTAADFFLPQLAQQYNPEVQTAVGGLRQRAARSGLGETPFALTSEAGLRGQASSNLINEAFQRAMILGQQRQSIQSGGQALLAPTPSPYLQNLFGAGKEAFGTFATFKALQGQQQPGVPFALPQPPQNQFQIPNREQFFPTLR